MYQQDYEERSPMRNLGPGYRWAWPCAIQPYAKNWQIYICPTTQRHHRLWDVPANSGSSYAYNFCSLQNRPIGQFQYPAETGTLFDWPYACIKSSSWGCSGCPRNHSWWYGSRVPPHNDGLNIAYLDGHAKWQTGGKVKADFWPRNRLFDGD